jgi:hypothetical protein
MEHDMTMGATTSGARTAGARTAGAQPASQELDEALIRAIRRLIAGAIEAEQADGASSAA